MTGILCVFTISRAMLSGLTALSSQPMQVLGGHNLKPLSNRGNKKEGRGEYCPGFESLIFGVRSETKNPT